MPGKPHQHDLPLIPHNIDGQIVSQRVRDGYINATAMCRVAGKQFNDYSRQGSAKAFVDELSAETGIPVSELIQTLKGGERTRGKRPGRGELTRLCRAGMAPTCSGHGGAGEDPPFEPVAR